MPYTDEWVMPELVMEAQGVRIYHAYKDDNMNAGAMMYLYTTDPEAREESCMDEERTGLFDIRELNAWNCVSAVNGERDHASVLRLAITDGELTAPEGGYEDIQDEGATDRGNIDWAHFFSLPETDARQSSSNRDLELILAALRYMQQDITGPTFDTFDIDEVIDEQHSVADILESGPATAAEIDELCERINTAPAPDLRGKLKPYTVVGTFPAGESENARADSFTEWVEAHDPAEAWHKARRARAEREATELDMELDVATIHDREDELAPIAIYEGHLQDVYDDEE